MLRVFRWAISTGGSLLAVYTFLAVPVAGHRTLWEHTRRIAGTSEAQDLGHDLARAGRDAAGRLAREALVDVHGALRDGGVPNPRGGVIQPVPTRSGIASGEHPPR